MPDSNRRLHLSYGCRRNYSQRECCGKIKFRMKMIKLGWLLTIYLCLSFFLFFITSNTIYGWIAYFFLLLICGPVLLWCWAFIWENRTKRAQVKWWIWSIVLALQLATILVAPGNCYGFKQGNRCYSNLQILVGNVPRTGASDSTHWQFVEDIFLILVAVYGMAVLIGVLSTSVSKRY
jgi:hypothetical protein